MTPLQDRREGLTYQKVISILFAGLLATTGIIWNNSQNQIKESLLEIKKLTEIINKMQTEITTLNYKIEMLQYRVGVMDGKIDGIPQRNKTNIESRATPRFR